MAIAWKFAGADNWSGPQLEAPVMRECPWCGRMNLNVYAYCHGCGRGFGERDPAGTGGAFTDTHMGMWLAGTSPASGLPAFWPVVGALAALIFGATLLWAQASDSDFAGPLVGATAAVLGVAVVAWVAAGAAGARVAEEVPTGVRRIQVVLVETADRAQTIAFERWLRRPAELRALAGVVLVEAPPSSREAGRQTLIRLELDEAASLDQLALERIIREHAGSDARVELFPLQEVPETRQPRVRMGVAAAATLIGGLLVGGVALAATYAAMSGGSSTEPVGPTGPVAFNGTIVARNTKFVERSFKLPPNTDVTLRLDNRDPSPPHNIQFFAGPDTTGVLLSGCSVGCPAGDVATAIGNGPIIQEFTFTTPAPGDYAYNCIVHPVEMRGTMTIEEGALPPA